MRISDWSSDVCSSDLIDPREVEDVVEDPQQQLAGTLHPGELVAMLVRQAALQHQLREADDGVQRRADLVAHVGQELGQIGRASCRARVCQYVEISVVAVSLKKPPIR